MVIVRTFLKVLLGHPNEMIWDHQKDCVQIKKKEMCHLWSSFGLRIASSYTYL